MRVNFNVINQKNVPALQSGTVRPPAGQKGRIFYNAAGVGMYIDNGTEWLAITTGSTTSPTLQQVTDAGYQTNNDIVLIGSSLIYNDSGTTKTISAVNLGGPAGDYPFSLPDASGVIPVTVNGESADTNGNIELSATVPTLQQVMNQGNTTVSTLIIQNNALEFFSDNADKYITGGSLAGIDVGLQYFSLPDVGGILPISVNGNTADDNGNIIIPALPYLVYTATITQNTFGDIPLNISEELLTIGVTYLIVNNDAGTADFTNVGAANNNVGTYFVATGTSANSWGDETAAILSYNEGCPKVVTVLENSIGTIWFTYSDDDVFGIESNMLFQYEEFRFWNASMVISNVGAQVRVLTVQSGTNSQILIQNFHQQSFENLSIELRVYPVPI